MRKQSQAKQKAWSSVTNHFSLMARNPTGCVQPMSKFVQDSIKHLISKLKYKACDTKHIHQIITRLNMTWQAVGGLPATAKHVVCDIEKLYPSVDYNIGIPAVKRMLEECCQGIRQK